MTKLIYIILVLVFVEFLIQDSRGQKEKVSPKLDFEGSDEKDNASSITNINQHENSGNGKNTSPKIHGVRVSVDTVDTKKKSSIESKESVENTENRNRKRVGIHTDITFEITGAGVEVSNQTVTGHGQNKDENDASVPVYKGRGSTTNRPRRPYDPKAHHWGPNYSSERRQQYPHNVPAYPGSNDEGVYRSIDSWSNFVPITSVWTTERSYYEPYRPNAVTGLKSYETYPGGPRWKPCYCMSSSVDRRQRREDTSSAIKVIQLVDSKLDRPFSSNNRR